MPLLFIMLAVFIPFFGPSKAQATEARHPVVLELFTSQGCSSCPPADRLLNRLADREGILALSFHVDYWNRLGWDDPYSLGTATQRQYVYSERAGWRVYTPQVVVQGSKDIVGSNDGALTAAIAAASQHGDWADIKLSRAGGRLTIHAAAQDHVKEAELFLVGYLKRAENVVPKGENAGARLVHRNSVTSIRSLGQWDGRTLDIEADMPDDKGDAVAVIAQVPGHGAILGAGWTD